MGILNGIYLNIKEKGFVRGTMFLGNYFVMNALGVGYVIADGCGEDIAKKSMTLKTPESVVDFDMAWGHYGVSLAPQQYRPEFLALIRLLSKRHVTRMLEIGTAGGGTLFAFCRVISDNAKIISLDLPYKNLKGGYPDWREKVYTRFAKGKQEIMLLRGDSQEKSDVNRIKKILGGEKLDFLFIDGDHSYKGAMNDFYNYSKFVKKGGIVAFHDILNPIDRDANSERAWNELKKKYKHDEFIANKGQNDRGMGVIYL